MAIRISSVTAKGRTPMKIVSSGTGREREFARASLVAFPEM